MVRCPLPIGIQSFRNLRERNCYYVDKTGYALRLVEEDTHFFPSRPQRFGKSLFLDMLEELFEGSREPFGGLAAVDRWNWSVRHPVGRLDFGDGNLKVPSYVETSLMARLGSIERRSGIDSIHDSGPERFTHLVETLYEQTGPGAAGQLGQAQQAGP